MSCCIPGQFVLGREKTLALYLIGERLSMVHYLLNTFRFHLWGFQLGLMASRTSKASWKARVVGAWHPA